MDSIRLPAVAALLATVGLGFVLARRLWGAWVAALLAVLMATDPVYMTMAKIDFGPVVISGLLRVGALVAYFAWLRTESTRYLWLLAAALALGVFNKLDFIAFVVALALAAGVAHHRAIFDLARRRPLFTSLPVLTLIAALALFYVQIYIPSRDLPLPESQAGFPGRLHEVWDMFRATMDGGAIYRYMTTGELVHRTLAPAVALASVFIAAGLVGWMFLRGRRRQPDQTDAPLVEATRTTLFFLVLFGAMAIEITATPQAVGPHHILLLWPLPAILGASLLGAAQRLPEPRVALAATALFAVGLTGLAASQVRTANAYRSDFAGDGPFSDPYTTEVYPLEAAVEKAAPGSDRIVAADWGISNQLLALGDEDLRERLTDVWPLFAGNYQPTVDEWARVALSGHRVIVVLHQPGHELMSGTSARVEAMIDSLAPPGGVEPIYRGETLLAYLVDDRSLQSR